MVWRRQSGRPRGNKCCVGSRPSWLRRCLLAVGCLVVLLTFAAIGRAMFLAGLNDEPALGPSREPRVESAEAEVVRVIDGDTIEVRLDGRIQTVRYLGIDAPEIDWNHGQHQAYALEAAQANRELVAGKRVRLEFDTTPFDIYGRLLAHVFVDAVHVNYRLIEGGYAQVFFVSPNLRYHTEFLAAQREACLFGRGLWGTLGHAVSVRQAPDFVGTFRHVKGYVAHAQRRAGDGLTELLLDDGSNGDVFGAAPLYIHIYPEARVLFSSPPEAAWVGLSVQVVGLIEYYGRGYRIVVRDPAMLSPLNGPRPCSDTSAIFHHADGQMSA